MADAINHTPIPVPQEDEAIDQKSTAAPDDLTPPKQISSTPKHPVSAGNKEAEPIRSSSESQKKSEQSKDEEDDSAAEDEKDSPKVKNPTPVIPKAASDDGLEVAPSAKPFPTIYDVKVPIYTDEQIEQNLHKSFWTGARWLAELCKYLLWQSHIKIKKIGSKIIRQQTRQ